MTHFRTITAVIEVEDNTALSMPGVAMIRARDALDAAGFNVLVVRNEHNDTGDLPPASNEETR